MTKRRVTPQQKKPFMQLRPKKGVASAAAAIGIHRSTGYRTLEKAKIQAGNQPSEDSPPRQRTRPDPLAMFFESKVDPILERCPDIKPITVFHDLRNTEPEFKPNYRRTLERRIRAWRAQNGAEKEVMFPQTKRPAGTFSIADFTHLKSGEVTIRGESLRHRYFHFRLPWSCYRYVSVVINGESFTALAEGIQGAFAELDGVPHELRTDSLSAAFRNLAQDVAEDLTERFKALCEHYGMKPSRNNRGVAHENGAIESAHRHLKDRVRGELELRGSRDFECLDAYRTFVAEIVARENVRVAKDIETERGQLNPLPPSNPCDCEEVMVTVTSTAGCRIRKIYYSVPSRLIGYRLKARIFDDRIELFQGATRIETLPRGLRTHRPNIIDYRHVIQSLKRQPMALARLTYRNDLFPRAAYRHFFDQTKVSVSEKQACRLTVDFLALAHENGCEAEIADAIEESFRTGSLPDIESLRTRFAFQEPSLPRQDHAVGNLGQYSSLLDNRLSP